MKQSVLRLPEDLHKSLKLRAVNEDISMKDAIEMAVRAWLVGSGGASRNHQPDLKADECRLLEEYRRASLEKRRRMLAFAATTEEFGPEAVPQPEAKIRDRPQIKPVRSAVGKP